MRVVSLFALLAASGAVQAASFDCSKAATATEKLICTNARVSDLDEYLEPVEESGIVNFVSDDPNQSLRQGFVVGNPIGIGVGDPFPQTLGTDVNTLQLWDSSIEFAGKVGLVAYFATF